MKIAFVQRDCDVPSGTRSDVVGTHKKEEPNQYSKPNRIGTQRAFGNAIIFRPEGLPQVLLF